MRLPTRFPFPFQSNTYQYSNNLKPLEPPVAIQLTNQYFAEIQLKRRLLESHHSRCYQADENSQKAQWEVLDHLLHELSEVYPEHFELTVDGDSWIFEARLTGETTQFEFGNRESLAMDPLEFIGRFVQEDLILMMQQDDELLIGAGMLCFPANWSLMFDFGMPFLHIHRPVPNLTESGLTGKIQRFLLRIEPGKSWTRLNWSLNAGSRLDTSAETFDEWGPLRYALNEQNISSLLHLRVEEQNLVRMPASYGLLFTIHTYLMPMAELVKNPVWLERTYHVMKSLPAEVVDYKGIAPYYHLLVNYLQSCRSQSSHG